MKKTLVSLLSLVLFAHFLVAQTDIYQCNFEDSVENAQWKLNYGKAGAKCVNKWYIGEAGANGGSNGLFASYDGTTNQYFKTGVSVIAMRDSIFLDAGDYELSFDWRAGGMIDDGLYVCWIPCSDATAKIASIANQNLPKIVQTYGLKFGCETSKLNQSPWNSVIDTIKSDGTYYRLVFLWNNGILGTYPPAACVDNIQIIPVGACPRLTNLSVSKNDESVTFSWEGSSDSYDVRATNENTGEWVEFNDVTTTSIEIPSIGEGVCTYYVRPNCGGKINGAWASAYMFIHYSGTRCIDYLTLKRRNCFIGSAADPRGSRGVVDFGYQSMDSRHTIHWDQDEYDPRTGGKLKTIPDGELASVRLGNWFWDAEGECIEYTYTVDTNHSSVLELKYAVVLQDPEGHDPGNNPRFTLKIVKEDGSPIDTNGCGEATFEAGANTSDATWHSFTDRDKDGGNCKGWWKEWTTVGINLSKYHGEELTIQLATYDCIQTGHYGYAYFTINCNDGRLDGLNCGNDSENGFKAPDGFNYKWYNPKNPEEILSTKQIFTIDANDTLTYYVDIIQPMNENCYYTLVASGLSRWPEAEFEYKNVIADCQNTVNFSNKSYIKHINQKTGETSNSGLTCDTYLWDFGDGTTSTDEHPQHTYAQGGKYTVTLKSSIEGKCFNEEIIEINLPKLGETMQTHDSIICAGDVFEFKGVEYTEAGFYYDTLIASTGCDSIFAVNLIVKDTTTTFVVDTITTDDDYIFGGKAIEETGRYIDTLQSIHGCDSVIVLDVVVEQITRIDIDSVVYACADDPYVLIPYTVKEGRLRKFDASFEEDDVKDLSGEDFVPEDDVLPLPIEKPLRPGTYSGIVSYGGELGDSNSFVLKVLYPDTILVQRWNDVIAVRNDKYNGGYEFIAYQWFKNNEVIEGAISSVLYEEEGLDVNAQYSVLLTRKDDASSDMTCALQPLYFENLQEGQSVIFANNNNEVVVETDESAEVRLWTTTGVCLATYSLQEGENRMTLNLSGAYLIEIITESGERFIEQLLLK